MTVSKMDFGQVENSQSKLKAYIESEEFKGYDPYDTLNSKFTNLLFGKWLPLLAIQFQKRNPLNIRPLIGIKKEINPKAIGLFLNAYANLYEIDQKKEILDKMDFFFEWLKRNSVKKYQNYCWGYNFPWASSEKFTAKNTPNIVVSATIGKGLFKYYELTRSESAIDMIKGVVKFVLKDLPLTEDKTGICFSYTPDKKDCCYNASLLGAEILARLYSLTGDKKLLELTIKALDFVCIRQKENGMWNYSIDLSTGSERKQIDFHQGYILESISNILKYTNINEKKYLSALGKGLSFYYKNQFYSDGRSKWRLPKELPVEIHNQAQGIITFTLLRDIASEYLPFAIVIAEWTIENMQDVEGFFYYQNHRIYKNKISYMRWSQAWMFLALTILLNSKKP
jgi:hypothetical protein